jgi:hypothetical protein|tara:strand:- start:45 stop:296 length:252 start_codon:yes stop_codon:yes gene_type:complete
MLYQLKNGRTIEISTEQFLSMNEQELNALEALGANSTMDITNPFFGSATGTITKPEELHDEHDLLNMPEEIKRKDSYFHDEDD